jgi:hypothetical protein
MDRLPVLDFSEPNPVLGVVVSFGGAALTLVVHVKLIEPCAARHRGLRSNVVSESFQQ